MSEKNSTTSISPFRRVDAHIHLLGDHPDSIALIDRLNLKLLNNSFGTDDKGRWRVGGEFPLNRYKELADRFPDRYGWLTGFDSPRFNDSEYIDSVIAELDQDFAAGPLGCKIWKNIGMEIRKPSGEFLMVDDSFLKPIFDHLERTGRPVLMHTGDPRACWRPLDEASPHQEYYRNHPEWHLYDKPEYPSHEQLIAARDHVVERHPKLCVVGAHLGSLEHDLAAVAERLAKYPNFFVDVSGRVPDLAYQDTEKVRQFFYKYPDRVLFGTDHVEFEAHSMIDDEHREQCLKNIENMYKTLFEYFESKATITFNNKATECLALPEEVLQKLYTHNSRRCYPGLDH